MMESSAERQSTSRNASRTKMLKSIISSFMKVRHIQVASNVASWMTDHAWWAGFFCERGIFCHKICLPALTPIHTNTWLLLWSTAFYVHVRGSYSVNKWLNSWDPTGRAPSLKYGSDGFHFESPSSLLTWSEEKPSPQKKIQGPCRPVLFSAAIRWRGQNCFLGRRGWNPAVILHVPLLWLASTCPTFLQYELSIPD